MKIISQLLVRDYTVIEVSEKTVFGKYGSMAKDTVQELLDAHLISFVGSDGHHPIYRSARLYRDYQFVKEFYGRTYCEEIFNDNAAKMLKNVDIRELK